MAFTMRWYQQCAWSLDHYFFFFFALTRTALAWLNVWDSIAFSLYAFVIFGIMYSKYVATVPLQIVEVIGFVPPVYMIIYVLYRVVVWMKGLQICKKRYRDELIGESEEPDRLAHPEDYEKDEVKLLLADGHYSQDPELETYPACGNSQRKYGSI